MPPKTRPQHAPADPDVLAQPPGSDVSARWAESASRVASRAYAAAYGREIIDDATRVRWHLEPRVAVTAAVAIILLGLGAWWVAQSDPALPAHVQSSSLPTHSTVPAAGTPGNDPVSTPTPVAAEVVVHVSGAVASPGLVTLRADARVADAVELAGGAGPNADLGAVNLARRPHDGEHVHVPEVGEAPAGGGQAGPIDLNSATAPQLEELPGIGPVLAERIVADREANGPFAAVEDLTRVSGVGPAMIARIGDAATA